MKEVESQREILDRLEQKAGDYEELFTSCAQGTLLALQEEFNLGNEQSLKAATAMPGIALRGETCGAVIGAIMALGLAMGRAKPEDSAAADRTMSASRKLCSRFEEEFGGCNCRDVQRHIFGRSFELNDPRDGAAFVAANAIKKCRVPPGKAARIAGEIILNSQK
ncbi:MAG: C_GCAxxG_C_C family protein [Dehalococcoidia bacterium]|nr:C_GCAxxG_C_C family protein [Dehalococcoidia bacterium]